jgi:hypothetical protein
VESCGRRWTSADPESCSAKRRWTAVDTRGPLLEIYGSGGWGVFESPRARKAIMADGGL